MRKFFWSITVACVTLITLSICAAVGLLFSVRHYSAAIPNYSLIDHYTPPLVSRVYSVDGKLLSEYFMEKRVFVPIDTVPQKLIDAFLAAEDKTFYQHKGLDFLGIIRAAIINLGNIGTGKRLVGASTITQQVAKNMMTGNRVSWIRKIKEALLAIVIDASIPKDKILELYLNQIYLGVGADGTAAYGVAVAAQSYFDKALDELTLGECAYLAGLAKGAANYSIKKHYARAIERRDWVIDRMLMNKFISQQEADAARQEPLSLTPIEERQLFKADYFTEEIRRFLVSKFGTDNVYKAGYSVHATLDPELQSLAEQCLCDGILEFDRKYGWRGPIANINLSKYADELKKIARTLPKLGNGWTIACVTALYKDNAEIKLINGAVGKIPLAELKWARKSLGKSLLGPQVKLPSDVLKICDVVWVEAIKNGSFALRQLPKAQGAIIVMNPLNGRVLAMHGGYSYAVSEYNRVTQAVRQPGSIIKPFIYLTAMDCGFEPISIVRDEPLSIELGPGQEAWTPHNVTNKFYGDVTLRSALERSINNATVALSQEVGLEAIARTLQKLDILQSPNIYPATVLGAGETTLMKLARAYCILANGGRSVAPVLIDQVQDKNGRVIFKGDRRICEGVMHIGPMSDAPPEITDDTEQMFDAISVYQITHILEGTSRRGSAIRARHFDFPFACKTGTTSNSDDTWVFGYTPNLVVGICIFFDQPECLGEKVLGANLPLPILIKFFENIGSYYKTAPFRVPKGVKFQRVDLDTGLPSSDEKHSIYEALREEPLDRTRIHIIGTNGSTPSPSVDTISKALE
ncbi:MAG: PBP1A family penicillin-binding protein [Holosporales bacterium]|nr:PBP1A family penicillin-binding protein [Holosporales bacterium]